MKIDFNAVEKVADFVTVPAGTYLCKIGEVQTGSTRNGDERWALRLVVAEGEYVGRQAAWDSLVFSSRGMARVRQVLGALRLPTTGTVDVVPEDLVDRAVFVEVRPAEYQRPGSEQTVRRNEVPYAGYSALSTDALAPEGTAPEGTAAEGTAAGWLARDAGSDVEGDADGDSEGDPAGHPDGDPDGDSEGDAVRDDRRRAGLPPQSADADPPF